VTQSSLLNKTNSSILGGINISLGVFLNIFFVHMISMTTTPGLTQYGTLVIIGLIVLVSLKEILLESDKWNNFISLSFNVAILPLLLSFVGFLFFLVLKVILTSNY
jgi:hypothetical protein